MTHQIERTPSGFGVIKSDSPITKQSTLKRSSREWDWAEVLADVLFGATAVLIVVMLMNAWF